MQENICVYLMVLNNKKLGKKKKKYFCIFYSTRVANNVSLLWSNGSTIILITLRSKVDSSHPVCIKRKENGLMAGRVDPKAVTSLYNFWEPVTVQKQSNP